MTLIEKETMMTVYFKRTAMTKLEDPKLFGDLYTTLNSFYLKGEVASLLEDVRPVPNEAVAKGRLIFYVLTEHVKDIRLDHLNYPTTEDLISKAFDQIHTLDNPEQFRHYFHNFNELKINDKSEVISVVKQLVLDVRDDEPSANLLLHKLDLLNAFDSSLFDCTGEHPPITEPLLTFLLNKKLNISPQTKQDISNQFRFS